MIPEPIKKYGLAALEGTPVVMLSILGKYPTNDPIWDRRPDPARFTLREAIAHVADWDEIFLARIKRTVSEDEPILPGIDESQIAIENNYASQDPVANLARFGANRKALVGYLNSLTPEQFERVGIRPEVGTIPIDLHVLYILAHDGYHTRQAAEFTSSN